VKWNGKIAVGRREGSWISSLVRRPDRMYSPVHKLYIVPVSQPAVRDIVYFGNCGIDDSLSSHCM
jgi:hypothetical protein